VGKDFMVIRVLGFFIGIAFVFFGIEQLLLDFFKYNLWESFGYINYILMGCLFIVYAFTKQNIAEIIVIKMIEIYHSVRK
jgi:uncharacterized membrane protein